MKRYMSLIMALVMIMTVFSGCGADGENNSGNNAKSASTSEVGSSSGETEQTADKKPLIYSEFSVTNSWESSDGKYTQLTLTVYNDADFEIKGWSVTANVPKNLKVTDKWGVECSVDGDKLQASPVNYTQNIAAKSKCDNMGLIVRADEFLEKFSGQVDSVKADVSQDKIDAALSGNAENTAKTGLKSTQNNAAAKNTAANSDNSGSAAKNNSGNAVKTTAKKTSSNSAKTSSNAKANSGTASSVKAQTPPKNTSSTPLANHGKLSVKGTDIVDKNGKKFQLKGVSTHGLAWYPQYVSKASFKTLRDDWGANMIRLAMYTAEYGGYCSGGSKSELESLVNKGVQACSELGMYAIIDWHILSDSNPNQNKAAAKSFFTKMAQKYKNYSNVIYEICNEPNSGTTWSQIKSYADEIIGAIRKYDKDAIIIVGTPTWSQDVEQVAQNPVKNGHNVMYAVHFYAATHGQWLRDKVKKALNSGTPVFVSEFSICDASGNGGIDYNEADKWKNFINGNNLSYAGWSLSNKAETSALIKSGCDKLSGWTQSDLSDTGKWLRKMIKG